MLWGAKFSFWSMPRDWRDFGCAGTFTKSPQGVRGGRHEDRLKGIFFFFFKYSLADHMYKIAVTNNPWFKPRNGKRVFESKTAQPLLLTRDSLSSGYLQADKHVAHPCSYSHPSSNRRDHCPVLWQLHASPGHIPSSGAGFSGCYMYTGQSLLCPASLSGLICLSVASRGWVCQCQGERSWEQGRELQKRPRWLTEQCFSGGSRGTLALLPRELEGPFVDTRAW